MSDKFTVLFAGRRGVPGLKGDKGDQGDPGRSIHTRGIWAPGTTYAPGDAVTSDSTAAQGIQSLFVQRDTAIESVSNVLPKNDAARWAEVGAIDLSNVTGAIWRVIQNAHGFTSVGQPVTYSQSANRWVLASNRAGEQAAVAVVREVISPNEVLLQGSGDITGLDPAIILPGPVVQFTAGRLYYASATDGFLTETPTVAAVNFSANAMLLATGPTSGVVLQWQSTPNIVGRRTVGYLSFYYDATPGQTVFSGVDLDGNTLQYPTNDQMRVLVDGVEISAFDGFTAATGTSVTLLSALTGGERVEIRVLAEPLQALVPSTSASADDIGTLFDGVARRFPLTVNAGDPLALGPTQNVLVWLDGNSQEPNTDYRIISGAITDSDIEFTTPPPAGTKFWAIVGVPGTSALPPVGTFTDLQVTNLLTAFVLQTANAQITGGTITGITDLAIADGGTGASDAPTARVNLGLGTIATQNANAVAITGGTVSGITDLAVADGGTGASDAPTARANLGAQATITGAATSVVALNLTASRVVVSDGSGKIAISSVTTTELGFLSGVTSAVQTQLNGKQPLNANLTAISPLGTAANRMIYTTGVATWAEATLTAFGRNLLDDADAAAGRTTLGLGTIATQNASAVSITGGTIQGITDLTMAAGAPISNADIDEGTF